MPPIGRLNRRSAVGHFLQHDEQFVHSLPPIRRRNLTIHSNTPGASCVGKAKHEQHPRNAFGRHPRLDTGFDRPVERRLDHLGRAGRRTGRNTARHGRAERASRNFGPSRTATCRGCVRAARPRYDRLEAAGWLKVMQTKAIGSWPPPRPSPLPIGSSMGRGRGEGQASQHRETLPQTCASPHPNPLPDIRRGEGPETDAPASEELHKQMPSCQV